MPSCRGQQTGNKIRSFENTRDLLTDLVTKTGFSGLETHPKLLVLI